MVKQFRGVVKISDVQKEFDDLINNINNIVDVYNASDYVQNIDYNEVSPELAPTGYTLSIGGLRKVLSAYNGCVLGCKVFDMKDYLAITTGLLLTNQGGIPLPSAKIVGTGDYLYYSPSLRQYKLVGGYKYEYKNWIQPLFSNNNTFGVLSAKGQYMPSNTSSLQDIPILTQPFEAFKPSTNGFQVKAPDAINIDYSQGVINWKFPSKMKIKQISFTFDNPEHTDLVATVENVVSGQTYSAFESSFNDKVTLTVQMKEEETNEINITLRSYSKLLKVTDTTVTSQYLTQVIDGIETTANDDYIQICKLNINRDLKLSNTQEFIVGEIDGFTIGSQTKNVDWRTPERLDTSSKPMFIAGVEGDQKERTGRAITYLCNEEVAWNQQTGHRNSSCWVNYNKLLIPKKVANPYRYAGGTRTDMTKVFGVVEKRVKK